MLLGAFMSLTLMPVRVIQAPLGACVFGSVYAFFLRIKKKAEHDPCDDSAAKNDTDGSPLWCPAPKGNVYGRQHSAVPGRIDRVYRRCNKQQPTGHNNHTRRAITMMLLLLLLVPLLLRNENRTNHIDAADKSLTVFHVCVHAGFCMRAEILPGDAHRKRKTIF